MKSHYWMVLGAILAAAGVTLGAYHAHGLQSYLESTGAAPDRIAQRMENAEVAVRYQMVHALGLIVLGAVSALRHSKWIAAAAALLSFGVALFSGGLYVIVFADTSIHWSIVPTGGLVLIVGWVVAAVGFALAGDRRSEE